MDIRQAILKAADHIERNPQVYDYNVNGFPTCGTPGCMLGYIGVFMGERPSEYFDSDMCRRTVGVNSLGEFLGRVDTVSDGFLYTRSAAAAVTAMRLYADKYHPAESRALIPASVMRIFTMSPAELQREMSSV